MLIFVERSAWSMRWFLEERDMAEWRDSFGGRAGYASRVREMLRHKQGIKRGIPNEFRLS